MATDAFGNGSAEGSIDLTVEGGTLPYTFAWTGGADTEDISGLVAGDYEVTVTDANGCSVTVNATIEEPALLVATPVATDALCNGASDGSIDLTVEGGTLPYTFAWTGGADTEDISALVAGDYEVTVTDANGCSVTVNATVGEPAALEIVEEGVINAN